MTICHHPADETLARFATGTLAAGPALVVATHLAGCQACSDQVGTFETVAAVLVGDLPPTLLAPNALARTLALAEISKTRPPASQKLGNFAVLPGGIMLPEPLRERKIGRWYWLAPGVRLSWVHIPEDADANVILLRVKANIKLPEHGHTGVEFTQVLEGSYADGISRYFPGDLLEADSDVEHRPVVGAEGDCMCLAAIEGQVCFKGWIGRMLQPFMRQRPDL